MEKMYCKHVPMIPGQYPLVINRLQESGMLSSSVVKHETPQYTRLADSLSDCDTMTSFAVVKDQKWDRLISWPRVQNLRMPDPPYT